MANSLQFPQGNIWGWLKNLANFSVFILASSGAPTSGTSGTGATKAGIGCLYVDTTAGKLYINTGTKASPTWTVVGTQS